MKTKEKNKYNYKQYNVIFDMDIEEEKALVDWLEKHKGKRNGYSVQLKKALKEMIDRKEIV